MRSSDIIRLRLVCGFHLIARVLCGQPYVLPGVHFALTLTLRCVHVSLRIDCADCAALRYYFLAYTEPHLRNPRL